MGIDTGFWKEGPLQLFMSPASPFVRKVRVAAAERGIGGIELVPLNPHERRADLVEANPLSKVPTLVVDDGTVHCGSFAICLYFDTLAQGERIVPLDGKEGAALLRRHTLADGALDALVTCRMEGQKSPVEDRLATIYKQKQTVSRVLDWFEGELDTLSDNAAIDAITLACLLTYSDFRFPDDDWRMDRPRLAEWLEAFSHRPAMVQTAYQG